MCEPKFLFEPPYISDPFEVFKNCFDMIYRRGKFLDAIKSIINKIGFGYQGAYCNFPDWDGPEEELYFEGVMFTFGDVDQEDLIVSEQQCFELVKMACERYLSKHPEDTEKVQEILAQSLLAK
jgi:hypothetical protein